MSHTTYTMPGGTSPVLPHAIPTTPQAAQPQPTDLPASPTLAGHMFDVITQELRMPLNVRINSTSSVEAGARGPLSDEQREPPSQVRHSGEQLLSMLNTMLVLNTINDEAMTVAIEPVHIADLIEDVSDCSIGLTEGKPIELRWEVAPDLPLAAANHTHIKEVLRHLLSNAVKFTDAGTITVRACRAGTWIELSVADSGIGIADEHHMAIFDDFYQVADADSRNGIGVGLGLGICRRLVELYGGRIWVESAPAAGSTFAFSLPLMESSADQPR